MYLLIVIQCSTYHSHLLMLVQLWYYLGTTSVQIWYYFGSTLIHLWNNYGLASHDKELAVGMKETMRPISSSTTFAQFIYGTALSTFY